MKIYSDAYLKKIQNRIRSSISFRIFAILVLGFLYFAAAKIALVTALKPGFVTPIWPSSGIGMAALLLFGYELWPGILLGSFTHNILIFNLINWPSWIIASITPLSIATGAVLEAFLGTYIIRYFIKSTFPVDRTKHVLIFVFVAIGSCIISATVGVTSLSIATAIQWKNFFVSWWTWWVGDAAGILVFVPLILSWAYNPKIKWSFIDFSEIFIINFLTVAVLFFSLFSKRRSHLCLSL